MGSPDYKLTCPYAFAIEFELRTFFLIKEMFCLFLNCIKILLSRDSDFMRLLRSSLCFVICIK